VRLLPVILPNIGTAEFNKLDVLLFTCVYGIESIVFVFEDTLRKLDNISGDDDTYPSNTINAAPPFVSGNIIN